MDLMLLQNEGEDGSILLAMVLLPHASVFNPARSRHYCQHSSCYTSWYLINPFMGGLLGLIVFIFFVVTGTSFTPNLVSDPNVATMPTPVIWLLAFIVGWQQNTAVQLLNGFLKMVSPTSKDQPPQDRPPLTPPPTTPPSK